MTAAAEMKPDNALDVSDSSFQGPQGPGSAAPVQQHAATHKACPPPHYQVLGEGADPDSISMFYMTVYKVALCPKPYSHDWGACAYAHEKENARRRDPLKFQYSSCICPNSGKGGECPNGLACQYSHTLFEYWLHPMRYRTQMCRSGAGCNRSLCFFAHNQAELRAPCQPMVLLERQQQQQQQQRYSPAMGLRSLAAAGGVRPVLGSYNVGDVSSWPLMIDQSLGQGVPSQRAVLLGTMPGQQLPGQQLAGTVGPMYAFGSAGDLTASVSSSSCSSSNAVVFVPGQAAGAATMLSIPAQQPQQQGVLRLSDYLLLKQQQWQQQQQLPQPVPTQLDALQQLQLQQQQQNANLQTVTQISGLPSATMAGSYLSMPVQMPEGVVVSSCLASSSGLFVPQYAQTYSVPAVGADVVAVSSGLSMLPTGM